MSADASPSDVTPSTEATLSWSHTPEESRFLRALVALPVGALAGGLLAAVIAVLGLAIVLFLGGRYVLGVAILLAFFVSIARVAPHHAARIRDGHHLSSEFRGVRKWWAAGGAVVGLGAFAVGAQFGRAGILAAVAGVLVVPLLVASVLSSEGKLDADAGTLTYRNTDIDLRTLDGVRRLSVGGYVVYRLSYVAGTATFSTPRHVVIPRRVDPEIRAAFKVGVAADSGKSGPPNRVVRLAAAGIGVFFLAFAGFLLTVEPTSAHPRADGVMWYAALVTGLFGVLFVGVGIRAG